MQNIEELLILCKLLRPASKEEINQLKDEILKDKIPWTYVIALANRDYLIPALYIELQNKKLFEFLKDKELKNYLSEIFRFNTNRNQEIVTQLEDIAKILTPLKIYPLFLKGSISLIQKDYQNIGMRSLTDIDIYIKSDDLLPALNELKKHNYTYVRDTDKECIDDDYHHLEPLYKEGMPSSIELHRNILGNKALNYITYTQDKIQKSTNPIFKDVDILTPTYRIYHAFLHTEIQDDNHRLKYLALRHLFDFTILVRKYYKDIDWNLLNQLVRSNNCKKILDDYLYMAKILFNLETPLTVDNNRTRIYYKKMIKSFELEGTFKGMFYPLIPKLLSDKNPISR